MKPIIITVFCLSLLGCLKENPLNQPFLEFTPQILNDDWEISTPEAEGVDGQTLNDIYKLTYSDDRFWSIRSLLVIRNGKLISEAYHKDSEDLINRHLIWSSTKQVLGILTGIALEHGVIYSIDDSISMYLDNVATDHPDKSEITIRNLLMMKSGIDYNNDGIDGETDHLLRQIPDDLGEFILSRPMINEPGELALYKDGDPHLLAYIIQQELGEPLDEWADRVLFSRIGVENLNWVRYKDGTSLGGYGIETTPREMAKIALLVQNKGQYGNAAIVPSNWINDMIQPLEEQYSHHLGFYWWSDPERNTHYMHGHGGQFAFILPDKDLLIVISAIPNTQGGYQIIADDALDLTDLIVQACDL